MGQRLEFIVANPSEAPAIANAPTLTAWPTFRSGGYNVLELALLHLAIIGENADAHVSPPEFIWNVFLKENIPVTLGMAYARTFAKVEDNDECELHEVPPALVVEIADAKDLRALVARWRAFELLSNDHPENMEDFLVGLQEIARRAREEKKSLLLLVAM